MPRIASVPLPDTSFLNRYADTQGAYVDCFHVRTAQVIDLDSFALAFFDSWIFRIERKLLGLFAGAHSDARDVQALASGNAREFAIWQVEERDTDQILLIVGSGPIRTWLKCSGDEKSTDLYFGSAVLPTSQSRDGAPKIGFTFRAFLWFHILYSKALLKAAVPKLG